MPTISPNRRIQIIKHFQAIRKLLAIKKEKQT